ncbi:diguanylate cyclase (GGDEF)-like protein [Desulfobotulus alkaliphilus]|uniref:diguanylate cyclase n=1 Tax=Desulfobotulus alkaliphilus TaxID=622671 RepID=A0A562RYK0_9BACT|nr:GGDEF domain-containing protein [Desulfobotulus alkaliphilus]TWI74152.1 diguanylate cyclase (GGDEF)-like protein [Desulfobotulus alkaliphilus]
MLQGPGMRQRIFTGIAALAILAMATGGIAFFNLMQVRSHAETLTKHNLPQLQIGHQIHQEVSLTGYHILNYILHADADAWERARQSTLACNRILENGKALAQKKGLHGFQRQILEMQRALDHYSQALSDIGLAIESIEKNHNFAKKASHAFVQNIHAYMDMQWAELDRQIESVFTGIPLLREGLNLSTEEELIIRQQRLLAGSRILDMGRMIENELWKGEVHRSPSLLARLLPRIPALQQSMTELLLVTRQRHNTELLNTAMASMEETGLAISNLIEIRKNVEKALFDHNTAYGELFHLAGSIADQAHENAMQGGNRTRAIADGFVKFLVPSGLIAICILMVLYVQVAHLEKQRREMNQLSLLAEKLQKAPTPEAAAELTFNGCRKLFYEDSGMVALLDGDGPPLWQKAWGKKPPGIADPGAKKLNRKRDTATKGIFFHSIQPQEGPSAFLAIRFRHGFPMQRQAAGAALARNVADHLSASLNALHLMEKLRMESITDALTGLYNRRYMEETLRREFLRCQRKNCCLSLLLLDADHFKRVNDTHGHETGDLVLIQLASLLKQDVRADDVACRIGGEEFLLILPGLCPDSALKRAEEIRRLVSLTPTETEDGRKISITVSMGLAVYPYDAKDPEGLIRVADKGLYAAKTSGRNRVCRYAEETALGQV